MVVIFQGKRSTLTNVSVEVDYSMKVFLLEKLKLYPSCEAQLPLVFVYTKPYAKFSFGQYNYGDHSAVTCSGGRIAGGTSDNIGLTTALDPGDLAFPLEAALTEIRWSAGRSTINHRKK